MGFLSRIKQEMIYACTGSEHALCRQLSDGCLIGNKFKRVYFYHIRKCGGTSLTQAFLSLSGDQSTQGLYERLCRKANYRLVNGGKVYVGFNQKLLEEGCYFYGFSQIPYYKIKLPQDTFTVVSLRDPVRRVFSHYKMINELKVNKIKHPVLPEEKKWLGNNFGDFLDRMPLEHLLREVSMFSETYSPDEAFENIAKCSYYYFVEDIVPAVQALASRLNLPLASKHARKGALDLPMTDSEHDKARQKLKLSYELIEKLKHYAGTTHAGV